MSHYGLAPLLAVVGTDTGVGKTVVGAGLIHSLRRQGLRVAAFKPVETGLQEGRLPGGLADWELLSQASGQEPRSCLGVSFPLPAAPLAAARDVGATLDQADLDDRLTQLRQHHDLVVLEGAGGLCVPYAEGQLWLDRLQHWRPLCLVVGRLGLGTINHTLLTCRELHRLSLEVVGVVLNTLTDPGPESLQTPGLIDEFSDTGVLCVIPKGCVAPDQVSQRLSAAGLAHRLTSRYRTD